MHIYVAHLLRIIGSIFSILADKSSSKNRIYFYNAIANFFCGLQYYLLNAISGAISSFVAIARNIIFYKFPKKVPLYALILYLIGTVLINVGSFHNFITFIPVLLVIIYSTSLYTRKVIFIKYAVIITSLLEIIYDIHYKAYVGIIVCIIDIIFVLVSLYKDKDKIKKEDKKVF